MSSRHFLYLLLSLVTWAAVVTPHDAIAGYELVCEGAQPRSQHKAVTVDCSNRRDFVEKLGAAWQTIRRSQIAGSVEDVCWKAYNQAKSMHPSISFENISDSFLARCNMGLSYVN
jgi:hypothetical protein